MVKVEFRLLQFIISHLTGDRVSVALLHWDGTELRVASSLDHLSVCEAAQRDVVRTSVKVIVRRAKNAARDVAREPQLNLGLQQLFPVREGLGGALYWAPVTAAETADAAAHFAQLSGTLKLDRERGHHTRRVSSRVLGRQLVLVGEELKASAPNRIKTESSVKLKKEFLSPLSWKNGRWHHAVPFSLDGLDAEEIDREVERLVGLVELAVPLADVPVLVALVPEGATAAKRMRSEARLVCQTLEKRRCEMLTASLRGKDVQFDQVRKRIQRDIATKAGPARRKAGPAAS